MYRLVWYATDFDVNREVNNGRGPVDFKIQKEAKMRHWLSLNWHPIQS